MGEIPELKQETVLVQETPRRLCESVASCKEIYEDILSMVQSFVSDGKSSTAKLLSCTSDIGMSLLSTLEIHFSMVVDGHISFPVNDSLIQEQRGVLCGRLKSTIASLLSETPSLESKQVKNPLCSCNNKVAAWSQLSRYHLSIMIFFSILILGYLVSYFRSLIF